MVDFDEFGREILVPAITFAPMPFPERIGVEALASGDVLVWFCNEKASDNTHDRIREATAGAYSHAGIYVGRGRSIDAGPDGVSEISLTSLLSSFELANVLRWKASEPERIEIAARYARSCIGYRYASLDAALLPLRRWAMQAKLSGRSRGLLQRASSFACAWRRSFPPKRATYCSQLIVQSYAAAGLFPARYVTEASMSPNDLITSDAFSYMGYISSKENPEFHEMDVNAPIRRRHCRQWR